VVPASARSNGSSPTRRWWRRDLGGVSSVGAAVDPFYDKVLADPSLSAYFVGTDVAHLKAQEAAAAAIGWEAARHEAYGAAQPLPPRRLSLRQAAGLVLAEDLAAEAPMPAFDTAAMDGYAVSEPGPFRLRGEALAGRPWAGELLPGEAVRISTGAVVPPGATGVLRVENACREGTSVHGPPVSPGGDVRRAGEDATVGSVLVKAGSAVNPAVLGLAASGGRDDLVVRPAPRVHLLVTGDELVESGLAPRGMVRDALGPMLPALVAGFGGKVVAVERVPDAPPRGLSAAMDRGAAGSDVLVVTGSTSVGHTDRLRLELRRRAARLVVDSVACRPGHPQLLAAVADRALVIGLPGNPFAAFVAAHILLRPLVAALAGRAFAPLATGRVVGDIKLPPVGVVRLVPVASDGTSWVALGRDRTGFLGGAAAAEALAAIGPAWTAGARCSLLRLT